MQTKKINYLVQVNDSASAHIRAIPHLKNSIYHNLDISGTLDFFTRRYVNPLARLFDISNAVIVDCAAGYAWFAIAYILAGGKAAIAVDVDAGRLAAAKEIARILSVHQAIDFITAPIQEIPLSPNQADIFVSVETLEHIGQENIPAALHRIKEIASQGVLLTTPNKFFPMVAHDTFLPFAHWLSPGLRHIYAKLCSRETMNHNNHFLSPVDLNILLDKFKPASSCLTFHDFEDYYNHFPFYLPYGSNEAERCCTQPSAAKAAYYRLASALLKHRAYWVMPSLGQIFVRR